VISYGVEHKRDIDATRKHFTDKLFRLTSRMHFPLTRKIAEERCEILKLYLKKIKEELKETDFSSILENME